MRAVLPYRHTWISQGMNGSYSHRGTKAIDFGSLAAYKDYNLYAPFDGTIVWADSITKGGTVAFQSDETVEYADGSIDYMTVITEHDNNRPAQGTKFKKGALYSHMGTAGGVSKHSHIEVQKGKFVKPMSTLPQEYGRVYKFENTIEPYKALFITDDTVIRSVEEGSVVEYPWVKESEANMSLIKIERKDDYDYMWSVDGNAYGDKYDITTQGGFSDDALVADGWELVLKVNGSLYYTYENAHYACGLEKSRGINNQNVGMTAVSKYNSCMAIAGINDELYYGAQSWIINKMLDQSYCAITGLGLILSGKKRDDLHSGFESQWNAISGRTVIGEDVDGNVMSYSFAGETGKSGMTCAQLQDKCLELGFFNAICLDGGGSVFRWYNGKYDISTSRKVKNALLLYRKKKLEEPAPPTIDYEQLYSDSLKLITELEEKYALLEEDFKNKTKELDNANARLKETQSLLDISNSKIEKIKEVLL